MVVFLRMIHHLEKFKRLGQKTALQPLSQQKHHDFIAQRNVIEVG